jgi:large subunit ribosomal protein L35
MPKQKTKKSAAKRFSLTARGKVKFAKAGSGHLNSSKSRKRKRRLRRRAVLSATETPRIAGLLHG